MPNQSALDRFERDALAACVMLAAGAWVVTGGRLDVGLGVVAGGALMSVSYLAIKGAVSALAAQAARRAPPAEEAEVGIDTDVERLAGGGTRATRAAVAVVKFLVRYALLAVLAYVMLTRLRLHPIGVVLGVSAPVVAAAAELVRLAHATSRARRPR